MKIARFLDDILLVAGCACMLVGVSMWSIPAAWITGGVMLIGFGVMVGVIRSRK